MSKIRLVFFLALLTGFVSIAFAAESNPSKNGLFPEEIISADQLKQRFDRGEAFVLFDARNKASFDSAHVQGALLPRPDEYYQQEELFKNGIVPKAPDQNQALKAFMQKYSQETPIVTYCNSNCHASAALALQLKSLGFAHIQSMEEGFQMWEKKGYPVARSPRVQKVS